MMISLHVKFTTSVQETLRYQAMGRTALDDLGTMVNSIPIIYGWMPDGTHVSLRS